MAHKDYARLGLDELRRLCMGRKLPFGPNTDPSRLIQILINNDTELLKLEGLRPIAAALGITIPQGMTRPQAEQILDSRTLAVLTEKGYYVPGERGKPYTFRNIRWVLSGKLERAGGFIKLTALRVDERDRPLSGYLPNRVGATMVYRAVYMPDTVEWRDR